MDDDRVQGFEVLTGVEEVVFNADEYSASQ